MLSLAANSPDWVLVGCNDQDILDVLFKGTGGLANAVSNMSPEAAAFLLLNYRLDANSTKAVPVSKRVMIDYVPDEKLFTENRTIHLNRLLLLNRFQIKTLFPEVHVHITPVNYLSDITDSLVRFHLKPIMTTDHVLLKLNLLGKDLQVANSFLLTFELSATVRDLQESIETVTSIPPTEQELELVIQQTRQATSFGESTTKMLQLPAGTALIASQCTSWSTVLVRRREESSSLSAQNSQSSVAEFVLNHGDLTPFPEHSIVQTSASLSVAHAASAPPEQPQQQPTGADEATAAAAATAAASSSSLPSSPASSLRASLMGDLPYPGDLARELSTGIDAASCGQSHLARIQAESLETIIESELQRRTQDGSIGVGGVLDISPGEMYIVKQKVGFGKTAVVHQAIWEVGAVAVAYKELSYRKESMSDPIKRKKILRPFLEEIKLLARLRHKNIVTMIGCCSDPHNLCVFTEWMARGSLYDVLMDGTVTMDLAIGLQILVDIARGMAYLHSKGLFHRDLKTHNILIDIDWTCKVADFGAAKIVAGDVAYTEIGTAFFKAPEVGEEYEGYEGYTNAIDVFSFGRCMWQVLSRKQIPYGRVELKLPPFVPAAAGDLMRACLSQVPGTRPSFEQILETLEGFLASAPADYKDQPLLLS